MRNTLFLIASVAAAGLSSAPVQAQWSNYDDEDDLIRCESRDGRTVRCATYGGEAQLVRQLSTNPCIRGRSWGSDSRGVWVSNGCRAEFRVDSDYGYGNNNGYGYGNNNGYGNNYGNNNGYGNNYGSGSYGSTDGLFRCESRDGRTQRCSVNRGRAQFVRQLSNNPCVRGQSWGSDSRGVWVSNGCRALFRTDDRYGNGYGGNYGNNGGYYGNDLVRCESRDNRSQSCAITAGRGGTIRLLRQLSDKACIENQTWGRSRTGVWVTQGCRAEFVVGRGGNSGHDRRPPGNYGGVPGGNRSDVFQDASGGREPGDLGNALVVPVRQRPPQEERQRPPTERVIERPRNDDVVGQPQVRPTQEVPGRIEIAPVEEEAPGRAQRRRITGGIAEPQVEAQPAPREREVEQAQIPR